MHILKLLNSNQEQVLIILLLNNSNLFLAQLKNISFSLETRKNKLQAVGECSKLINHTGDQLPHQTLRISREKKISALQ
jgi:hypothetical protein